MTEMCIVDVPDELKKVGITVMCGPFFSIMPFPSKQAHSFSHVRYTPHYEWDDNTAGTLNVNFESLGMKNGTPGETNNFVIDLNDNPDYYIEYFIGGKMIGELFRIDMTESSLNPLKIEKIIIVYDVSPLI